MDLKQAFKRSIVIIAIIAVSVLIGFLFQIISEKAEMSKNPLQFEEFVTKYSDEYGVPEYVIYSVIKNQSNFDSSILFDDGSIGLMKVSPDTLEKYKGVLHDSYDEGMLYDPETNIKYGTYLLSRLYVDLGTWQSVYAAMYTGEETVLEWLLDTDVSDIAENVKTQLRDIPDKATAKYVSKLSKTADIYKSLYFDNND